MSKFGDLEDCIVMKVFVIWLSFVFFFIIWKTCICVCRIDQLEDLVALDMSLLLHLKMQRWEMTTCCMLFLLAYVSLTVWMRVGGSERWTLFRQQNLRSQSGYTKGRDETACKEGDEDLCCSYPSFSFWIRFPKVYCSLFVEWFLKSMIIIMYVLFLIQTFWEIWGNHRFIHA